MRAYFINSETDEHREIGIEPSLEEYYRLIGCRCVDFIIREIDGHPYNIILDDEGLLKPNRVAAVSVQSNVFGTQEHLAGNLLIFGIDTDDYEHGCKSLTDEELLQIQRRMIYGVFADGSEHPILFEVTDMTDKQLIDRLRKLVRSMYVHIDNGCTDYHPWDSLGGCAGCKYAVHGRYECKKFEGIKRRMRECGIDWEELL